MKNNSFRKSVVALAACALSVPLGVVAQTTVFSDNFGNGSTLNGTSTPGGTPTASSTSYDIASSKAANTVPSIASGDFKIALNAATTSGFVEAQAVFTTTPVTLATVNDYMLLTYTFTDTANLLAGGASSAIYTGLYNSGASTPLAGSLNISGLSATAGSGFATGNAANWQGYVASIRGTGANSATYSRPIQSGAGTSSANQELIGNNFGGGAYNNPASSATFSGGTAAGISLVNSSVYTLTYKLTLSAAGVLTINQDLYSGVGTGGTDLSSQTATTTSTLLTSSFDGLAIGARNSGTSFNPTMDISQITITDLIQPVPEPSTIALLSGGVMLAVVIRRRAGRG